MADTYDLIVLGSGPGGYVAAIRAAQLGLKTAIVERELLGGICLNWGCIPTKALLRSAEVFHQMQHAKDYGLVAEKISADLDAVVKRSRGVAKQLNQGVTHLMKKNKIAVHMGEGRLTGAGKLTVTDKDGKKTELAAKNIIVATGARARDLPFAKADGKRIWTYRRIGRDRDRIRQLLQRSRRRGDGGRDARPDRAGRGCRRFGVPRKSAQEAGHDDHDRRGHQQARCRRQWRQGDAEGQGRQGKRQRVQPCDRRKTDAACRTNVAGVWAIGDITAPPWLAHKASHEGVIAAEAIAGKHPHAMDPLNIPACTYCHPQIASVGLTEAKAKEAGYQVKVGNFPFIGNGKAIALGEPEGFIKTVFDAATGELLGAHMIGAEVTELIQGYTIGKTLETTEAELMETVFPHPTLSEMMHESVLAAYGRALHI